MDKEDPTLVLPWKGCGDSGGNRYWDIFGLYYKRRDPYEYDHCDHLTYTGQEAVVKTDESGLAYGQAYYDELSYGQEDADGDYAQHDPLIGVLVHE